jgi:anti-sigma factor RsiW
MSTTDCKFGEHVERWFDGELAEGEQVRVHLAICPACRNHLALLERVRTAVQSQEVPRLADAQMPAFLDELRIRVEKKPARTFNLWAMVSAGAAAIVVAFSLLSIFSTGPQPIEATVIEEVSTDIQGATTESSVSDDGTATVWINLPEGDLW